MPVPDEDEDDADDADEGTPAQARLPAFDQRTMHFLIHGRGGAAFPAGSIVEGLGTGAVSGAGFGFGGGIGLGLSRYLVLEASGGYARLGGEDGCNTCSASMFDLGLGFSYHLAQGIAFDPWISYSFGFRSMSVTSARLNQRAANDPEPAEFSLKGLDFTRLALGGEFYPLPALGFGPYFEADFGTTIARSDDSLRASVYAFLQLGVRVTFDPVSKTPPRASSGTGSRHSGLVRSF